MKIVNELSAYERPLLEVIEVNVENGFAGSYDGDDGDGTGNLPGGGGRWN